MDIWPIEKLQQRRETYFDNREVRCVIRRPDDICTVLFAIKFHFSCLLGY